MGPFVDAWLRVHGDEPDAVRRARDRFLAPLVAHLDTAGLGHVSEVADAEPPHLPGGCPFQAWSVGELLRVEATLREHTSLLGLPSASVRGTGFSLAAPGSRL